MKKAVQEEIARNDSLRLFFVKKNRKKMQYFVPKYENANVETCDFTGKTEEDMFAWLQTDASKPVYYLKGESYRIKLFKAPDGRGGIFININHASMDISAVLLFLRDLLNVYSAMENHTEMPKPLSSFEDVLQEELRKDDDVGLQVRLKSYFEKLFDKHGPSFYAGVDGMRQLNEVRRKKKDANRRYLNIFDPLNDRAETLKLRIEAEDYEPYSPETIHIQSRDDFDELIYTPAEPISLFSKIMFRAKIVLCDDGSNGGGIYILCHHLCCDGYSIRIIRKQLESYYLSYCKGMEPPTEREYSITDFFKYDKKYVGSKKCKNDKKWWRQAYNNQPNYSFPSGRIPWKCSLGMVETEENGEIYTALKKLCADVPGCSYQSIALDEFPLNVNGKVDRKELAKLLDR